VSGFGSSSSIQRPSSDLNTSYEEDNDIDDYELEDGIVYEDDEDFFILFSFYI